jgi:hypothetical protein
MAHALDIFRALADATRLRIFSLLLPEHYDAFSAARYERDHHIAPHDDRAYTQVRLDGGEAGHLLSLHHGVSLRSPRKTKHTHMNPIHVCNRCGCARHCGLALTWHPRALQAR